MQQEQFDIEVIDNDLEWNDELEEDIQLKDPSSLVVYSRDWTVETISVQIQRNNIELNPKFQRRNAWTDKKRSKLIESLLINVPVPEIVLAEDKDNRGKFIVIDGKQRLLAIAGYLNPEVKSWDRAVLSGLKTYGTLNGKSFLALSPNPEEESEIQRELRNADIRCTVISSYSDNQVLYDIFYRLNAGSVPLSSQELRQVLNKGEFADFLINFTNKKLPLHTVMRLKGPDTRLRDAEILLRHIALEMYGELYIGNLSQFLEDSMRKINDDWNSLEAKVAEIANDFNAASQLLLDVFPKNKVGRKSIKENFESRFNRALFETEVYYFVRLYKLGKTVKDLAHIPDVLKKLCTDVDFLDSIESTTKTNIKYFTRFNKFRDALNTALNLDISAVPVKANLDV